MRDDSRRTWFGALVAGGESEGVIGIEARDQVLRPPAPLYWAGLRRHGIRLAPGSMGRYHASLDGFYRTSRIRRSEGDETELVDAGARNWQAGIPKAPEKLLEQTDFQLSASEAEYLRERFITSAPDSFLAWGLRHHAKLDKVAFPWEHPHIAAAPEDLRELVETGRRFSLLMFGAVLAYNISLAEAAQDAGLRDGDLSGEYRSDYISWATDRIQPELNTFRSWDRAQLWRVVEQLAPGRVHRTRAFAEQWIARVLQAPATAADDPAIRSLIAARERSMKGNLARLENRRALERWSGRSGVYQLSYRWNEGRTLMRDIADGLSVGRT